MRTAARSEPPAYGPFSRKHLRYMGRALGSSFAVAEGAVRAGKTIDNVFVAAQYLKRAPDKFHLATGSTIGNAKLNIGVCNGFGLENLFSNSCHWGKYRDNEALYIDTPTGEKVIIFAGGGKADSYRRILGNSYGLWIATEINEHYDCDDSRTSFIKVAMARQAAAREPLILWDLNPSSPRHKIYTDYIDRYRDLNMPGYLYEHFTISDNASVTPEQLEAFTAKYDKTSVWYKRDILGQRVTAEGLIYRVFADNPDKWSIAREKVVTINPGGLPEPVVPFTALNIGVDYGGNGSAHTFVACAITENNELIALKSERIPAKGTTVEALTKRFLHFAEIIRAGYGKIDCAYCDSAEQTIINTFRNAADFPVANARKYEINDRIRATDLLISSNRFRYIKGECDSLAAALSGCVWDKDKPETWVRLDDGTSDIDTLDAFEYSWERWLRVLIRED